ncbi:MAG: selenide, water dikinase SelD, partial [Deltaproteobacteria bacterium]|nr:selenide, water dikinase SelD [Deltaproteobacteria bacterium]
GLLGHIAEMICGTGKGVTIESDKVPVLAEADEFGSMGLVPVGAHKNREFRKEMIQVPVDFNPVLRDILFDPQTSGGLLIGCMEKDASSLVQRLHDEGIEEAAVIGLVTENPKNKIQLL